SHFSRRELQSEYLLDWSREKISSVFEYQEQELNFINSQIEKIKAELEVLALPKQAPAYGICVGDVHSGNAHFSDAKEPTLFDFDQCGYGWRAFDIGKFMDVTYAWKMSSAVRQAFLDGYQAIRQLSDREKHSIRTFTLTARIWVMGINTSVAGDVVPYSWLTDEWLESKLALLHQLDRNDLDIIV
ncbi:MAG TPA: phosphotransferase, partial [Coleofasciculaceae cyanobacterium]